jgi:hypothetical protein
MRRYQDREEEYAAYSQMSLAPGVRPVYVLRLGVFVITGPHKHWFLAPDDVTLEKCSLLISWANGTAGAMEPLTIRIRRANEFADDRSGWADFEKVF